MQTVSTAEEDPDAPVLARVGAGDMAALRGLVAAKLPRVHGLALRLLGDRAEADDIAQETFVRIWRHAGQWRPGEARFDAWLHRVVFNLCTDRLRRRREIVMAEPPDRADPSPNADRRLEDDDTARSVQAALARLPPRQREAIVLDVYQELSNTETAAIMGVSVDALESLLARGRRTLRTLLVGEKR